MSTPTAGGAAASEALEADLQILQGIGGAPGSEVGSQHAGAL